MKFHFKIQQYQTDATAAVVKVFDGQGYQDKLNYIRDIGNVSTKPTQLSLGLSPEDADIIDPLNDSRYKDVMEAL